MRQSNKKLPGRPNVVGIVDSPRAADLAAKLPPSSVDFLEWRADCLPPGAKLPPSTVPWLVTARHPAEGGRRSLTSAERRKILTGHVGQAAAVDIEVRSLHAMRGVVDKAIRSGVTVVASFHDFKKTPSAAQLQHVVRRAVEGGAGVLKVAAHTSTPSDIATLLGLLAPCPIQISVMGMGPLGMASRVLFASCGSVLNYGWLDRPNATGQWSAIELADLLRRTGAR